MQKLSDRPASPPPLRRQTLRMVLPVVIAGLIAVAGFVLDKLDIAVVSGFDKHVGDWRIALGSPKAERQRQDILLLLVDEETLLDYESRSPIDRALVAELVRAVDAAGPKAIGLDLIFDRRTRHDARLIAALREAKAPVVLGNIDRRIARIPEESLQIQAGFLTTVGKPHGHLMLARKESLLSAPDTVVRYIAPPYAPRGPAGDAAAAGTRGAIGGDTISPEAFVDVLATAAKIPHRPPNRLIAWQRPPANGSQLFPTLTVPRHKPEAVKPALEGILPAHWRDDFKGRVVLIGASMIDRDLHQTPLSVLDRSQLPGIEVHAQALAQRIDGNRDIRPLPDALTLLFAGAIALACFLAARHAGLNPEGALYGFAGGALIGLFSLLAFWLLRIDIPSIALAIAWALGGTCGFVSNWLYDKLGAT